MRYVATFVLLVILGVLPCFGQATQTDSQTLQAILVEMRGLHNDVRLSETTQILLTELGIQQTAVNLASQRRDTLKSNVAQIQAQQKNIAGQLAQFEDRDRATIDPAQKRQLTQVEEQLKSSLAMMKIQDQDRANDLQDAESALRKEQDSLAAIQDQLNEVVKKLQPVTGR